MNMSGNGNGNWRKTDSRTPLMRNKTSLFEPGVIRHSVSQFIQLLFADSASLRRYIHSFHLPPTATVSLECSWPWTASRLTWSHSPSKHLLIWTIALERITYYLHVIRARCTFCYLIASFTGNISQTSVNFRDNLMHCARGIKRVKHCKR